MGHELELIQMPGHYKSQMSYPDQIILHGTVLESVLSAKYLGVTISDNISWSPHIDSVSMKSNQTLGFLKSNIKVHNRDLKVIKHLFII